MKILLSMTIKPPCFFMFSLFSYVFESPHSGFIAKTIGQKNQDTSHEG